MARIGAIVKRVDLHEEEGHPDATMKLLIRIILVLVLLLVVAVFGLNWFLEKGLTPAIQKALPAVEEKLGAPVAVGGASVSLLAGSVTLDNVAVGNPEGFQEGDLFSLARSVQDIAVWPLLTKREIRVEEVTIEQSNLTVVRNTDGVINVKKLLENIQKAAPPKEPQPEEAPPAEEPPSEDKPLPPFQLEHLFVTSLLTYLQEKESGDPFRLGLNLKVTGEGLGTIGEPTDRGTFSVKGNLAGNQDLFVIGVDGKIAPITDPLKPTFEIEGKVDSVELKMFEVFKKDFNLDSGMMGLDMVLHAKDGVFDAEKSVVRVLIAQPEIGGGLGVPAGFQPASLAFPVRVSGTVQEPKVNFMEGLKEGLRDALTGTNVGKQIEEKAQQAREQAEAAAKDLKDQAGKAAAGAEAQAKESLEGLKEGKIPSLGGGKDSSGNEKAGGFGLGGALDSLTGGGKDEAAAEETPSETEEQAKDEKKPEKESTVDKARKGLDSLFGGGD